jgi:hypothetical protein
MTQKKCVKYFGAHYCPYSNETSRTYYLINNLFKRKYPEVMVEVYWGEDVNEDNKHEFLNANAQYVPIVTNQNYAHLNLSLPDNFKTDDKTDEELTFAILENIYNQLDKKKDNSDNNSDNQPNKNTSEEIENVIQENNKESKDLIKKTLGYLNNNKFIGFLFISLIIYLIIVPFLKKNKNVSSPVFSENKNFSISI